MTQTENPCKEIQIKEQWEKIGSKFFKGNILCYLGGAETGLPSRPATICAALQTK